LRSFAGSSRASSDNLNVQKRVAYRCALLARLGEIADAEVDVCLEKGDLFK
jgi:hypothetical protein